MKEYLPPSESKKKHEGKITFTHFAYTRSLSEVPTVETLEMFVLKVYKDKDVRMRTYNRIKRAQEKKKKVNEGPDPENNVP